MEPIFVDGWKFDGGRYSRGSFIVVRDGPVLKALMKTGHIYVQIGTKVVRVPGDTLGFLSKVSEFQRLKEEVYV